MPAATDPIGVHISSSDQSTQTGLRAALRFGPSEIEAAVEVRYGTNDVLVPAAHGASLADYVPGAEVIVDEEAGHLADPRETAGGQEWPGAVADAASRGLLADAAVDALAQ